MNQPSQPMIHVDQNDGDSSGSEIFPSQSISHAMQDFDDDPYDEEIEGSLMDAHGSDEEHEHDGDGFND
jgi:hypothetical protein